MENSNEKIVEVNAAFRESLIQYLEIETLRKFITVPLRPTPGVHVMQVFHYGDPDNKVVTVPLEQYSDYLDVTNENAISQAKLLGAGCAILYNALMKNAQHNHKHNVIVDLLDNNLKFNHVMNQEPSVADPCGLRCGWISFRFAFASSNVASSLKRGATLAAVEGRKNAY